MSANDLYALPSEYNDLRESVRALAEKEIAPHAAAVDEDHRYPQEAADALLKSGLSAAHVPTEFGGEGADALVVVLIICNIDKKKDDGYENGMYNRVKKKIPDLYHKIRDFTLIKI